MKPRGARDDGKSEGVMSIRMYDSINHRSVEDHPLGPQDGVGRIQQNNGLLCSRLPLCYFVFYFQAPQAGVKVNSSSRLFSLAGHAFVDGSLHPFFFFLLSPSFRVLGPPQKKTNKQIDQDQVVKV